MLTISEFADMPLIKRVPLTYAVTLYQLRTFSVFDSAVDTMNANEGATGPFTQPFKPKHVR